MTKRKLLVRYHVPLENFGPNHGSGKAPFFGIAQPFPFSHTYCIHTCVKETGLIMLEVCMLFAALFPGGRSHFGERPIFPTFLFHFFLRGSGGGGSGANCSRSEMGRLFRGVGDPSITLRVTQRGRGQARPIFSAAALEIYDFPQVLEKYVLLFIFKFLQVFFYYFGGAKERGGM